MAATKPVTGSAYHRAKGRKLVNLYLEGDEQLRMRAVAEAEGRSLTNWAMRQLRLALERAEKSGKK